MNRERDAVYKFFFSIILFTAQKFSLWLKSDQIEHKEDRARLNTYSSLNLRDTFYARSQLYVILFNRKNIFLYYLLHLLISQKFLLDYTYYTILIHFLVDLWKTLDSQ